MITTVVEYEDKRVTLARPTLADGRVRRQIWAVMNEKGKAKEMGVQVFGYFITQIYGECEGMDFEKLTLFPGAEAVDALYEKFITVIDEAFNDLLLDKIAVLNGYNKVEQDEKKASAPSSNGTSAKEAIPTQ